MQARNDESGTPFCITIDEKSSKQKDVTIRDRDTTKQIRVNSQVVREEVTEKECVPDVTAIKWWLRNRRPDKWRDKQKEQNRNIPDFETWRDEFAKKRELLEQTI